MVLPLLGEASRFPPRFKSLPNMAHSMKDGGEPAARDVRARNRLGEPRIRDSLAEDRARPDAKRCQPLTGFGRPEQVAVLIKGCYRYAIVIDQKNPLTSNAIVQVEAAS